MATPIVYGPTFSTYVRSARLALEEKGQDYRLVEVDMFKGEHKQPPHVERNPFGQVPAFEHEGLMLYETDAILRYVDEVFTGPSLQPREPRLRVRMNQVMGIVDSHAYPNMISKIVIQRVVVPMTGGQTDMAIVEGGKPVAETCLKEFERILDGDEFLAGPQISLADLLLAPIMGYFTQVPEGAMLEQHPRLQAWWQRVSARPSMAATAPKLG
jgi:glutathione S-transferase